MTPFLAADRRHHPLLRVVLWFVAPLDDRLHGLSLTRLLAVTCFVFVGHGVFGYEHPLTWVDYAVLMLGLAAAFGKAVILALISHSQLTVDGKDVRETVDMTVRQIQERRAVATADGWPGKEPA